MVCWEANHYQGMSDRWDNVWGPLLKPMGYMGLKKVEYGWKQRVMTFTFSCTITQPLLAHHWRVHLCLLTPRFTAPLIPWGASAPGGKMRKQLLKDHNFFNNSPIFIIESSTLIYLLFRKHCIQYILIWKIVLDLVKGTWHYNFMAGCGSLLWANICSLLKWDKVLTRGRVSTAAGQT